MVFFSETWEDGKGTALFLADSLVCACVCLSVRETERVCAEEGGKLEGFGGRGLEQNSGTEPEAETHANLCVSLVVMKGSVQDTRDTN